MHYVNHRVEQPLSRLLSSFSAGLVAFNNLCWCKALNQNNQSQPNKTKHSKIQINTTKHNQIQPNTTFIEPNTTKHNQAQLKKIKNKQKTKIKHNQIQTN